MPHLYRQPEVYAAGDHARQRSQPRMEAGNINMENDQQVERPVVVVTGTPGPRLGAVDIGRSDNAYIFQVALPGVRRPGRSLSCDVQANGRVVIEGVFGDPIFDTSGFRMILQHPRGPFKVSFNLPGPVDPRLCSVDFRSDGILEAVVAKAESSVLL